MRFVVQGVVSPVDRVDHWAGYLNAKLFRLHLCPVQSQGTSAFSALLI